MQLHSTDHVASLLIFRDEHTRPSPRFPHWCRLKRHCVTPRINLAIGRFLEDHGLATSRISAMMLEILTFSDVCRLRPIGIIGRYSFVETGKRPLASLYQSLDDEIDYGSS